MKFINCLVLFLILILEIFLVSCNKAEDLNIHLNGDEEITIEVKSEYEELGIELPNNYTYEIFEDIDTNKLGKQEVNYVIYDKKGNKVKELKRIINVVDTTAPTIKEAKDKAFYLGVGYNINDFISNSYDEKNDNKIKNLNPEINNENDIIQNPPPNQDISRQEINNSKDNIIENIENNNNKQDEEFFIEENKENILVG